MAILIVHFIAAFGATVSFAILFNSSMSTFTAAGFAGAVGWTVFVALRDFAQASSVLSNLIATLLMACLSEIFARQQKKPVTLFIVPAIVVLVPGYSIYKGMIMFLNDRYIEGMSVLLRASMDSGAIAVGILVVGMIMRAVKNSKMRARAKLVRAHRKLK